MRTAFIQSEIVIYTNSYSLLEEDSMLEKFKVALYAIMVALVLLVGVVGGEAQGIFGSNSASSNTSNQSSNQSAVTNTNTDNQTTNTNNTDNSMQMSSNVNSNTQVDSSQKTSNTNITDNSTIQNITPSQATNNGDNPRIHKEKGRGGRSPLCTINPKHLTPMAKSKRNKRC
jgi:hypothetical protein